MLSSTVALPPGNVHNPSHSPPLSPAPPYTPPPKRLSDFAFLVLLNGEEVQDSMEFWHDAKTLGVSIQCYGTTKRVQSGDNNLGFRYVGGTAAQWWRPVAAQWWRPVAAQWWRPDGAQWPRSGRAAPPCVLPHPTLTLFLHLTPPRATTRVMQKGQTLKLTHVIWR